MVLLKATKTKSPMTEVSIMVLDHGAIQQTRKDFQRPRDHNTRFVRPDVIKYITEHNVALRNPRGTQRGLAAFAADVNASPIRQRHTYRTPNQIASAKRFVNPSPQRWGKWWHSQHRALYHNLALAHATMAAE